MTADPGLGAVSLWSTGIDGVLDAGVRIGSAVPSKRSPEAATMAILGKLVTELRETQAKSYALLEEIDRVLGGGAGIGELLKRFREAFDLAWCARYAPGQQNRYVWSHMRDTSNMKRLLRTLALEDIERRIVNYMKNDEPFYVNARHNFSVFFASINSHAGQAERPEWTCPSTPPCEPGTPRFRCYQRAQLEEARKDDARANPVVSDLGGPVDEKARALPEVQKDHSVGDVRQRAPRAVRPRRAAAPHRAGRAHGR